MGWGGCLDGTKAQRVPLETAACWWYQVRHGDHSMRGSPAGAKNGIMGPNSSAKKELEATKLLLGGTRTFQHPARTEGEGPPP